MESKTWLNQFGRDPNILNKTFVLDGKPYTLVGIMPPRFALGNRRIWLPAQGFAAPVFLMARLKPGITVRQAAAELDKEGISLEVVDLRSLLPYDEEAVLASVSKCNKVILLHEDTRTAGMAGELAALIAEKAFEHLDGPIVRITAPDTPVPFSPPLEDYFLPNAQKVADAARKLAMY